MKQKTTPQARTPEEARRVVMCTAMYEEPRTRLLKADPARIRALGRWGERALRIARAWDQEGRVPNGEEKMVLRAVGYRLP